MKFYIDNFVGNTQVEISNSGDFQYIWLHQRAGGMTFQHTMTAEIAEEMAMSLLKLAAFIKAQHDKN